MVIQTRIFHRVVDTGNAANISTALTQLQDDVNTFTAGYPPSDILDIRLNHESGVVKSTINSWFVMTATVIYVQP